MSKGVLRICDNLEEANGYIRKIVAEDCNSIGIKDWKIINEILRTKNHKYDFYADYEFDEAGGVIGCDGYVVYVKKEFQA